MTPDVPCGEGVEDDALTQEDELLSLVGMSVVNLSDLEEADAIEDDDE